LDEEDVRILESLGELFDLLYNSLPSSKKAEVIYRIKNAANGRKATIFGDYPTILAVRTSRYNKEERELQQAAANIGDECEIVMEHLNHIETASAGIHVKDVMTQTVRIVTKSSIKR
jgi:hypothetical protein